MSSSGGEEEKKKKNRIKKIRVRVAKVPGSAARWLSTCRWELKVASFKVPQVPSFGEAQFKDCGRGMRCKSAVAAAAAAAIAGKQRARERKAQRNQETEETNI